MATQAFTLPNGHILRYKIYGQHAAQNTVFFHHGLPGSHVEASIYDEQAKLHGLRVIGVDRPGSGDSTFQADYRLLSWPAQILALANELHVERFALLGASGGAPYLLACLHELPASRIVGAGIVAGVYPSSLGWEGMALETKFLFTMGAWSPWMVEKTLEYILGSVARDVEHPEKLEQFLAKTFESRPPVDKTVWDENLEGCRDMLIEDSRMSLKNGSKGAVWEFYLAPNDWGFKLQDIKFEPGKLIMWHGALDANWPANMARKAALLLPGADLRMLEGEGHVSVLPRTVEETMKSMSGMFATK
jgi:pimeloyl-ACP methyl ester carboxylesterase